MLMTPAMIVARRQVTFANSAARNLLGAHIVVAEPMRNTPSARRIGDVYFALYFTAMGRGRARSPARITALLKEAGFRRVRHLDTHVPLQTSVLVAEC